MATDPKHTPSGDKPNSDKAAPPDSKGGNAVGNARQWAGGGAAARGKEEKKDEVGKNARM